MELRDGMFAVKLCELEHQYGLLRSRLELCQGADHEKIRHLLSGRRQRPFSRSTPSTSRPRACAAPCWRPWPPWTNR